MDRSTWLGNIMQFIGQYGIIKHSVTYIQVSLDYTYIQI